MDNGPAKKASTCYEIQNMGDMWADPFEISTIRRDVSVHLKFLPSEET